MIFTTKAACQVLGRDRKQQADDIASGHCGHVPPACASLRYWEPDDLAAELFFIEQRGDGHSVRMSGTIATRLRTAMRQQPEVDQLTLVTLENGNRFALPADTVDLASGWTSGAPIREALTIDVRNLRARVQRRIDAHRELIGAVDETA